MSAEDGNGLAGKSARIERLAGLGRLWGALKYFHPYLGYKDIDWDAALISAIPRVEAADSPDQYRATVDHLLCVLEDPATHTLPLAEAGNTETHEATADSTAPTSQPSIRYADDSITIIAATDYSQFDSPGKAEAFRAAFREVEDARALVLDLRRLSGDPSWYFGSAFQQAIPVLLGEPLRIAGPRHRVHSGHRQQRGPTHGGYYSGWIYQDGAVILPDHQRSLRPLAVLINAGSANLYETIGGLQSAGLASIVHEGDLDPEADATTYVLHLPDEVDVQMRLSEFVYPNGSIGFRPDLVVSADASGRDGAMEAAVEAVRQWTSRKPNIPSAPPSATLYERAYADMKAPSPEYRLLALFRFWNAIHYFFPYKHLLDEDWNAVLLEFIAEFAREGDDTDYTLTVARLVARIQDTHGSVNGEALQMYLGAHIPCIRVRDIQGETVITDLLKGIDGEVDGCELAELAVGDVVLAVDGEKVEERRARLGHLFAASTPQALAWRVHKVILAGAEGSPCMLTLRGGDGQIRDVTIVRMMEHWRRPQRPLPIFGVLPEGFGYMDLERLTIQQVDEAFEAIKDTPGLIFDIRGYPNGTAWLIAPRLTEREVVTARFGVPELHSPDLESIATLHFLQKAMPSPVGRYQGIVVALIDEDAISQSEHTCLFLEAAADATFVGSPTNGANGNVTNVVLPGGLLAGFTGMEVLHADGRQLQRLGIQPHLLVRPTVAGIREGRDEVLAAAVTFLQAQTTKP